MDFLRSLGFAISEGEPDDNFDVVLFSGDLPFTKDGEFYPASSSGNSVEVIDRLLLHLLERRVAVCKKPTSHDLETLLTKTDLNPLALQRVFSAIEMLTNEAKGVNKTFAVLGPEGSYSEEAALNIVGSRRPLLYCPTTNDVIKAVEEGRAEQGLVPIENSLHGTVIPVLDALLAHKVEVFGETKLDIIHCLVAKDKLSLQDIDVLYSHPQAVAQCINFITNYLPHVEIRYTSSTSDAVKLLDDRSAAISSENAARLNNTYILRRGIQDASNNVTRFYLIRKKGAGELKGKITALFFGVENRPGALKDVLDLFYRKGINLRKLESRPAKTGLGEYIFFAEAEKDLSAEDLKELKEVTAFYKIIGVF